VSLLLFSLQPYEVVILTDTLATTPSGDPYLLVSKCSVIPHLEMVIAFTGLAQIGHRWAQKVQTEMLARDMDMLDQHVPSALRAITEEVTQEFGRLPSTSTIYHLGYSEISDGYSGYVYRSEKDFESETMEPGFRAKPQPGGSLDAPVTVGDMVNLGIHLRAEQGVRPRNSQDLWMESDRSRGDLLVLLL
jgi:hypothetical protein